MVITGIIYSIVDYLTGLDANIYICGSLLLTPEPLDTFVDIKNRKVVLSYRSKLLNKSGIYSFICLLDGMRYIGSSNNLYKRLLDHLAGRKVT